MCRDDFDRYRQWTLTRSNNVQFFKLELLLVNSSGIGIAKFKNRLTNFISLTSSVWMIVSRLSSACSIFSRWMLDDQNLGTYLLAVSLQSDFDQFQTLIFVTEIQVKHFNPSWLFSHYWFSNIWSDICVIFVCWELECAVLLLNQPIIEQVIIKPITHWKSYTTIVISYVRPNP